MTFDSLLTVFVALVNGGCNAGVQDKSRPVVREAWLTGTGHEAMASPSGQKLLKGVQHFKCLSVQDVIAHLNGCFAWHIPVPLENPRAPIIAGHCVGTGRGLGGPGVIPSGTEMWSPSPFYQLNLAPRTCTHILNSELRYHRD